MDALQFAAALGSALLHAGWNALVKSSPTPRAAMAASMLGSAILSAVALLWIGLPALATVPWMAVSTGLNLLAVMSLLRAYESGPFGTVYPIARAVSVLGVALLSPLLTREWMGGGALAGVALVVAALAMLAFDARRAAAAGGGGFTPRSLAWTLVAGGVTALYVFADAQASRAGGSVAAYGCAVSITNALAMAWRSRDLGTPFALLRDHWHIALPTAFASMASYLLILWVWSAAPIAPAAALRDTSAIFAMLIAVFWMREALGPRRLVAVALALAGVPLLRLG
ncbi:MAG: hypothetical protein JNK67_15140 [Alphaproteobacteria bacterium]|nr:hypothetical protein [Alphaproteobacteria bacterium]